MMAMAKVSVKKMAIAAGVEDKQAKIVVVYFRKIIFIPFLDNLLLQLLSHLDGGSEAALLGPLLIPVNLHKLNRASKDKVLKH